MKRTDWIKYESYMRSILEAKYPEHSIVWVGANNFVLVKDGKETKIKYQ